MTPEQFAYWLQGFAEINAQAPNDAQWTVIKDHLAAVFTKVTPNRATPVQVPPSPGLFDLDKAFRRAQEKERENRERVIVDRDSFRVHPEGPWSPKLGIPVPRYDIYC